VTSPYFYLPIPRHPGLLPTPTHRPRCRVRFQDPPAAGGQGEEELSSQLEGITLDSSRLPPAFRLESSSAPPSLHPALLAARVEREPEYQSFASLALQPRPPLPNLCSGVDRLTLGPDGEVSLVFSEEDTD